MGIGPVTGFGIGHGCKGVVVAIHEDTYRSRSDERACFGIAEVLSKGFVIFGCHGARRDAGREAEAERGSLSIREQVRGLETPECLDLFKR